MSETTRVPDPSVSGDPSDEQPHPPEAAAGAEGSRPAGTPPRRAVGPRLLTALAALTGGRQPRRWVVLLVSLVFQSAALVAIGSVSQTKHILGIPGSLLALTAVVAGALGGPLVGVAVALSGGAVYYAVVADLGAKGSPQSTAISVAIWITTALLSALLADALRAQSARVRSASAYARSLIEASLDPLVTITPEGKITDVNEATEQVTGRRPRRAHRHRLLRLLHRARAGARRLPEGLRRRAWCATIRWPSVTRRASTTDVLYNATVYRDEAGDGAGRLRRRPRRHRAQARRARAPGR